MTFNDYWQRLEEKKGHAITGQVTMTAEQFRRMQQQAFEMGSRSATPRPASGAVDELLNIFAGRGRR